MTFDEATESTVTLNEALAELSAHGIAADYEGRELFDCHSGETITRADDAGLYSGGAILAWLGY